MHREITPSERLGRGDTPLSLYLLTALIGLLLAADLWPVLVQWLGWLPSWVPTWERDRFGFRFALIAAVIGGSRVLYNSLESLFEGRLGADLSLALACIAAILIDEPVVAAEVVFIGMLGEVLENITFQRSQRAIRSLLEITPRRCWLLRDGQEMRILVSELKVGDIVVVKPGARVPGDGIVREGALLDVSALTGESLPVEKGPGDEVLAGSLNQHGALTIEVTRVAEQTVVGRVLTMTVQALQQKGQAERTADRLARYFLPVVLGLAMLTFLVALVGNLVLGKVPLVGAVRLATYPALSVLVVACPCALILATPAAVLAALGRLAGTGILIKGGSSLERLAEVNAFAFDKTGTLTEGRLELGEVLPLGDVSAGELLRHAATAEQRSEHLLARLIVAAAAARGLTPDTVEDFQAHPGAGVTARTSSGTLLVGTRRLLEEQGVAVPEEALAFQQRLDAEGQTSLLVALDGRVLGVIGARDRIRPEAADVLTQLRNLGIENIALLTGDRRATAETVAAQLGIQDVHAELLPEQKATLVASPLTLPSPPGGEGRVRGAGSSPPGADGPGSPGKRIAFVGDGVNDAPALAQAHVGLAIGSTDVAAEAGDIVFMGDPLRHLPLLVRLSRETVRIIRQNILLFAFAVNLAGVVLTAWLWPLLAPAGWWYQQSPLVAVLYHQLGSLLVLLNSMRLLWFEKTQTSPRLTAWRHRFDSLNSWMECHLNLDEWLHGLSHHWRMVLGIAGVIALGVYGLSGLRVVNADEIGVVRRFGAVLEDDLEPGIHWRWPWPIEDVTKVTVRRLRSVEVGFRTVTGQTSGDTRTWSSPHGEAIQRYADESVMITGDDNLIEVLATVHYTIADVRTYLFEVSAPEELLRFATESVLRELIAGRGFTPLLTRQREPLQQIALERLRQRSGRLGLKLESLTLQELHPPPEVVPAFHNVARAMETEQQDINRARAAETKSLAAAEADVFRLDQEGKADSKRIVRQAQTGLQVFLDRWQARDSPGIEQELRLIWQTLCRVKRGQPQDEVNAFYLKLRREELARQVRWTDDRLRREVLERTLPGRETVVIDAPPQLASLLYALDQLREILGPMFSARPPRPTRGEEP